jgi:hypothetical protein
LLKSFRTLRSAAVEVASVPDGIHRPSGRVTGFVKESVDG